MNGVSQEGMGITIESFSGIISGLLIAFLFQWKITAVALGTFPLMIFSSVIQADIQKGYTEIDEEGIKEANLISSDAIMNFKTIQSFGFVDQIVKQYEDLYQP